MTTRKDDIEIFFDYDLHIPTRTIYMGSNTSDIELIESGTDYLMAEKIIKSLYLLENKSRDNEISIIMNNPGGDWYHGMAIYDCIRRSPCHITVVVYGHAMSMGSIILQAADKRMMSENSTMLIHQGSAEVSSHAREVISWGDETKRTLDSMINIYCERSGLTRPKVEKLCDKSTFITAQQAVELNLADEIIK